MYHYTPRQARELKVSEYNLLMEFAEKVAEEQKV